MALHVIARFKDSVSRLEVKRTGTVTVSPCRQFCFRRRLKRLCGHFVGLGNVGRAADYIVEGSVLRSGQRLRIDTRLVRTRDDVPIWSGKVEREWAEVFAIQDEISRGIVNSLRLKFGRGRRRYETSAEGYDLCLRARALGTHLFPGDDEAIGLFEKAIARDPSLAPAYAGLSSAYAWKSFAMAGGRKGDRSEESRVEFENHVAFHQCHESDPGREATKLRA